MIRYALFCLFLVSGLAAAELTELKDCVVNLDPVTGKSTASCGRVVYCYDAGVVNSSTVGEYVDGLYSILFDRPADAAGKAFYVQGFNEGRYTRASLSKAIIDGAQGPDTNPATAKTNQK